METETDRLFRVLEEGISSATPESLLGETSLKIEQLRNELTSLAERAAKYRRELQEVERRIDAMPDFSELEALLARHRAIEHQISVNSSEQHTASLRLAEETRRLDGLRENFKACLVRQWAHESNMSQLTQARYKELLEPVQREMEELVGIAVAPATYQTPPDARSCWL